MKLVKQYWKLETWKFEFVQPFGLAVQRGKQLQKDSEIVKRANFFGILNWAFQMLLKIVVFLTYLEYIYFMLDNSGHLFKKNVIFASMLGIKDNKTVNEWFQMFHNLDDCWKCSTVSGIQDFSNKAGDMVLLFASSLIKP